MRFFPGRKEIIWVGVKIKPPGDRRFWSMFPLTRAPCWVPFFDPHPSPSDLSAHPNAVQARSGRVASFSASLAQTPRRRGPVARLWWSRHHPSRCHALMPWSREKKAINTSFNKVLWGGGSTQTWMCPSETRKGHGETHLCIVWWQVKYMLEKREQLGGPLPTRLPAKARKVACEPTHLCRYVL